MVRRGDMGRLRGRIARPPGWISLANLDTGDCWVRLICRVADGHVDPSAAPRGLPNDPEFGPGKYIIIAELCVASNVEFAGSGGSRELATLPKGAEVDVVEVSRRGDMKRVRGRIAEPAGWISLANLEDGRRWAVAVPAGDEKLYRQLIGGSVVISGLHSGRWRHLNGARGIVTAPCPPAVDREPRLLVAVEGHGELPVMVRHLHAAGSDAAEAALFAAAQQHAAPPQPQSGQAEQEPEGDGLSDSLRAALNLPTEAGVEQMEEDAEAAPAPVAAGAGSAGPTGSPNVRPAVGTCVTVKEDFMSDKPAPGHSGGPVQLHAGQRGEISRIVRAHGCWVVKFDGVGWPTPYLWIMSENFSKLELGGWRQGGRPSTQPPPQSSQGTPREQGTAPARAAPQTDDTDGGTCVVRLP